MRRSVLVLLSLAFAAPPICSWAQEVLDPLHLVEVEGTARVALTGSCHNTNLAVLLSVPQATNVRSAAVEVPDSESRKAKKKRRRCERMQKKICRQSLCKEETSQRIPSCRACVLGAPCEPGDPELNGDITRSVQFRYQFAVLKLQPYQWGCNLTIIDEGEEVFYGICDGLPKLPALDTERRNYLYPFSVTDKSPSFLGTSSTYGSFHGYLVGSVKFVDQILTLEPSDIYGITGVLVYSVSADWLGQFHPRAPWKLGNYPAPDYVCVYSGRFHAGNIPLY